MQGRSCYWSVSYQDCIASNLGECWEFLELKQLEQLVRSCQLVRSIGDQLRADLPPVGSVGWVESVVK
jgi:hypothetical protein